ncbi:MAG: type II toxin-antitoxin system VapC family toxin [Pseudomonadota bacterium]
MSGWLLDTNTLSELRKPKPEAKVVEFVATQSLDRLYVSTVTFAEIRFGIEKLADVGKRSEINLWLQNKLRPMFGSRVLEVSEDVLLKWRLIIENGRKKGHTFSHPDVLIAATAACHDLVVATRDVSDMQAANVATFNPWSGELFEARDEK